MIKHNIGFSYGGAGFHPARGLKNLIATLNRLFSTLLSQDEFAVRGLWTLSSLYALDREKRKIERIIPF